MYACRALIRTELTLSDLRRFDFFYRNFLRGFISALSTEKVTPNMHLVLHMTDCCRNFGPVYAFWLFAFERFNGMLGRYSTNGSRGIESQLLVRLSEMGLAETAKQSLPSDILGVLSGAITSMSGFLSETAFSQSDTIRLADFARSIPSLESSSLYSDYSTIELPKKFSPKQASAALLERLRECYSWMYPASSKVSDLGATVWYFSRIRIAGCLFSSQGIEQDHGKNVFVCKWFLNGEFKEFHVSVLKFFRHSCSVSESEVEHLFVYCQIHSPCTFHPPTTFDKVVSVIEKQPETAILVPVHHLLLRSMCAPAPYSNTFLLSIPLISHFGNVEYKL